METPLAIIALDRMIVIPACKAQQIGRLAFTFRHESEGPHHATAIRLRHILNLAHMMLATGEAWRIAIMFGNPPNPVMPFPDVGIVKHFLHHPRIGREAGDQRIDIAKIEGQVKASSIKRVSEFVEKHPDESVAILRNWLHEST